MATITATANIYNAFRVLLVEHNASAQLTMPANLECDFIRIRGFKEDSSAITTTLEFDGSFLYRGGVAKLNDKLEAQSSLRQYFSTYVRIDIDELMDQGLPEGTDITFKMEEGFLKEDKFKYPSAQGYNFPQNDNFYTMRTPWKGNARLNSQFDLPGAFPYRLKYYSSNFGALFSPNFNAVVTRNGITALDTKFQLSSIVGGIYPIELNPQVSNFNIDINEQWLMFMLYNEEWTSTFDVTPIDGNTARVRFVSALLTGLITMDTVDAFKYKGIANENFTATTAFTAQADRITDIPTLTLAQSSLTAEPSYTFGVFSNLDSASNLGVSKINGYPWDEFTTIYNAGNIVPVSQVYGDKVFVAGSTRSNTSETGTISVYDLQGNYIKGLLSETNQIQPVYSYYLKFAYSFTTGKNYLAAPTNNNYSIRIWDADTLDWVTDVSLGGYTSSQNYFSFNGDYVTYYGGYGVMKIKNIHTGALTNTVTIATSSPDIQSNRYYFYVREENNPSVTKRYLISTGTLMGTITCNGFSSVSDYSLSEFTSGGIRLRYVNGGIIKTIAGTSFGYTDPSYLYSGSSSRVDVYSIDLGTRVESIYNPAGTSFVLRPPINNLNTLSIGYTDYSSPGIVKLFKKN